jgi:type I restriction enzyme R subunit
VFGNYIDIYDMRRAVDDGATVPIYYESRLAELELAEDEKPHIDEEFEEITEQEEESLVEGVKERWTSLEAVVGAAKRLDLLAQDIVQHFEAQLRRLDGKGMIVCMSRRICVELYNRIIKLRPEWHSDDDEKGVVKVVMTGAASDPPEWQRHVRDKKRRERLAERFKDEADPFKLVIVRDMWLTGFDCPSLHTMYIDKPMRGHTLMQAIARVNRVFANKPGGRVVDYIGLLADLKQALAIYSESSGQNAPVYEQAKVAAEALKQYDVCLGLLHGFNWTAWTAGTPEERYQLVQSATEYILAQDNGAERFIEAARKLARFFVLAMPHADIAPLQDNVAFIQAVLRNLVTVTVPSPATERDMDAAVAQLVSKAIAPQGVIDLIDAHGLANPDISLFSEEFLEELRTRPQKQVSVRLLKKLLENEISRQRRVNLVRSRTFSEMLQKTLTGYRSRTIDTVQVIEELIALARFMKEQDKRGVQLGLSEEEFAFYDALATNDSAVQLLGDKVLCQIARELAETIRNNTTVDWMMRENVRAKLRSLVKRALRRHNYPPDKQEEATQMVLKQAETLSEYELSKATA